MKSHSCEKVVRSNIDPVYLHSHY
ncbi:unnamed protein product [Chondrus crispus]|uniref:Uncharacterized protein n=1 Tax=Chondrus crispus TaxID=2769 RepID=R7Q8S4_CHOCR|nr:unnamed protein product [Chondrus crispus]CDF34922.1 unnamed protein product [Chondrus crispus]|eukprot:XP_005714741.1 unnamed protein product [Chondrus crispus]